MKCPVVKTLEGSTWLHWLEESPLWMVAKLEPMITEEEVAYSVEFKIYEVQSFSSEGAPIFVDKDEPCRPGKEPKSIDQAAIYSQGFFKWDGCSEFEFDESHTCDWESQEVLLGAIGACRRVSQRVFDVPRVSEDPFPPEGQEASS